MRIVHCCLSCFYIDDYTYQENMLVREHVNMGHDVLVLASTEIFNENKELDYTEAKEYMGSDGAKVVRLPYAGFLPFLLKKKIRSYPGVFNILLEFRPDIILFHGPCALELLTVSKYALANPSVKLYVDCHEDEHNSARGWLSRFFLYGLFYVPVIKLVRKSIEKFLYITYESKQFCQKIYGLSERELEFFPLGGVVFNDEEYVTRRSAKRAELNFDESSLVFFQSGKFDEKKKLLQSLRSFSENEASNAKLIVAGEIAEPLKSEAMALIGADPRVEYLGWVDSEQLQDLLCAADVYVQPGSQSATLQMSICARCAVIVDDVPSHRFMIQNNGVFVKSDSDLVAAYRSLIQSPSLVCQMKADSYAYASKHLNYETLAARVLK